MGKRVVHLDTGQKDNFSGFDYRYTSCKKFVRGKSSARYSSIKEEVTCKKCLKKLGISLGDVDLQKKAMALAIDRDWCQVGNSLLYCIHCKAKGMDDQNFNHKDKCVVPIAQEYLESLEV